MAMRGTFLPWPNTLPGSGPSGMVVAVRERSLNRDVFQQSGSIRRPPVWMSVDSAGKRIQIINVPARDEMELPEMREQFIVEFYSR